MLQIVDVLCVHTIASYSLIYIFKVKVEIAGQVKLYVYLTTASIHIANSKIYIYSKHQLLIQQKQKLPRTLAIYTIKLKHFGNAMHNILLIL